MRNLPDEVEELRLLRELQGYTRETLLAEPAPVIERYLILLEEEAAEHRRQMDKANHGRP